MCKVGNEGAVRGFKAKSGGHSAAARGASWERGNRSGGGLLHGDAELLVPRRLATKPSCGEEHHECAGEWPAAAVKKHPRVFRADMSLA